jgi:3-methyladenine DNA glycosylase AlkD
MSAAPVQQRLRALADLKTAEILQRFFKTGPGEYGEGDRFHGIKVPVIRKVANEFASLSLTETRKLLSSAMHEERLAALLILVRRFSNAGVKEKKRIFDFYLRHTQHINNWDLVDLSADKIVGAYLYERSRQPLYTLAGSQVLWNRRIAIIATLHFIRRNDFGDTLGIAERLRNDKHDLIHKAVGWMLREVGKRSPTVLEEFLRAHYRYMPRTMLRYAIERFPEDRRRAYLCGTI